MLYEVITLPMVPPGGANCEMICHEPEAAQKNEKEAAHVCA